MKQNNEEETSSMIEVGKAVQEVSKTTDVHYTLQKNSADSYPGSSEDHWNRPWVYLLGITGKRLSTSQVPYP